MDRLLGIPQWLRQRDPQLRTVHRAVRVTLVACAGFYTCRYGLHDPVMGTYALFGAVATGVLSQLGGGPRERSRTLLLALPAAYLLVTAGTLLAVTAWTAALGMLVIGFAVSYGSVGGPRLVGLANGFQLFYILPCFPPYHPGSLFSRLAGVTIGLVLLAAAERLLWPGAPPVRYQDRLARAAHAVARLADLAAATCARPDESGSATSGGPDPDGPLAESLHAVDATRPSRVPALERPASAGAVDRALTHSASAVRYTRTQLVRVLALGTGGRPHPAAAALLRATAQALHDAGAGTCGPAPAPETGRLEAAIAVFEEARFEAARAAPGKGAAPSALQEAETRLRLGSIALDAAEGTRFLLLAVRISRRAPVPPDPTPAAQWPGPFWYAHESAPMLLWRRFRGHFTVQSVYFQNAVRTALALAAARLVVGALDLSHGFWALLATLTLMRTCAADTQMTLRPALTGTLVGAAATALLLFSVGQRPVFYAAALPVAMLVAFTVGPLLGLAWAQGLFTLVIAMVFTQLAPASWQLAETRLVDVVIGALVGTLAGLCAWPRGGGSELRRGVAGLLADSALALQETVAVVTGSAAATGALPHTRRTLILAEASYAQYQTERHGPVTDGPSWQAALLAGQHTTRGGETLLFRCPPGALAPWPRTVVRLNRDAARVAVAFQRQSRGLRLRERPDPADLRLSEVKEVLLDERTMTAHPPSDPLLLHAIDLSVWLSGLLDDLTAIDPADPSPVP